MQNTAKHTQTKSENLVQSNATGARGEGQGEAKTDTTKGASALPRDKGRDALHTLCAARGARIAEPIGRGWINKQLAMISPDDRARVWADKSAEAVSVARCVHLTAAAYAVAIISAPLPACAALVARGMSGGRADSLALAVVGRGRRDPLPGSPWHRARVGIVWPWAARESCRLMGKSYRSGVRTEKQVAAGWSISGNLCDRAAAMAAEGKLSAPVRRASVVVAIRSALAQNIWDARRGVRDARFNAMTARTPKEKSNAGGAIGAARTALKSAVAAARALSGALVRNITEETAANWFAANGTLTQNGEKFAQRFRDANQRHACVERPPVRSKKQAATA